MFFLNISIITYNDISDLKKQLNLLNSVQLPDDVKISIYDNCSDYEVHRELKDYENIGIYRHDKNIGADSNIFYALNNSDSIWTWVLSTNDFVDPSLLLNFISQMRLVKSSVIFTFSLKNGLLNDIKQLKDFQNKYERLFHISFMMFNTAHLKKYFGDYEKFIPTQQAQFFFLLELICSSKQSWYFMRDYLFIKATEPGWDKESFLSANLRVESIMNHKSFLLARRHYGNYFLRTHLLIFYLILKESAGKKTSVRLLVESWNLFFRLNWSSYILIKPLFRILILKLKNLFN
jgi:GT2 family glycosyltransferase